MKVAVVGAGIVGLTIAHELTRRGASVHVWDPHPAGGATWAAAGMLAPASEFQPWEGGIRGWAREAAAMFPSHIALLGTDPARIGYRPEPTLAVGWDAADGAAIEESTDRAVAAGAAFDPVPAAELRHLEPGIAPVSAAFRAPADHAVDPRALAAAIMRDLDRRAGSRSAWLTGTAIVGIDAPSAGRRDGTAAVTDTRGGRTTVDAVVLATGHKTPPTGSPGWLGTCIRPVYGDVLRLRSSRWSVPLRHTVRGVVRGRQVYLVPRADGGIVLGASDREDGATGPLTGAVGDLINDARTIYPSIAESEVVEVGARARPATRDNLPLLGAAVDDEGADLPTLVLALGAYRHGVLLSPWIARTVADEMLDAVRVPAAVAASRWEDEKRSA
ncbi:FAD-dependent oxidoreductase [Microbacterium aureliae]